MWLLIPLIGLLLLTGKKVVDGVDRGGFLNEIKPAAAAVSRLTGIPVAIIATQAAHESNYGNSGLARNGKNLFGIKAGETWRGETIMLPTYEVIAGKEIKTQAAFRKYPSWEASIKDWLNFLHKPRYSAALAAALAGDATKFFIELQKAGYATDPKYAQKLDGVFNSVKGALA